LKGWYGESARHSLAAKGVPVGKKYLYHGTLKQNIPEIRQEGIHHDFPRKRWVASRDYIYLAPTPHEAHYWVWAADASLNEDDIVVLRIPTGVLDTKMLEEIKEVDEVEDLYSEWLYNGSIRPEDIQILLKGRWRKLT